MTTFIEYLICEANRNNVLLFGMKDLATLSLKAEDDASEYFNININNDIYKFLDDNVTCPEFFSFIISELYTNKEKLDGLFADNADEKNKFMTSAKDTFINLICIDGTKRESIIRNIVDVINAKIKADKNYPISAVTVKHHEVNFAPTTEAKKKFKFKKLTIHIVQPTNDRALNKISSDITEFMPTIALKLIEKAPSIVQEFLNITQPAELVKFLQSNLKILADIASENAVKSVINGIQNNSTRPKIIEKVKNGNLMAKHIVEYAQKFTTVKDARVTNEKNKNDSADLRVTLDGKDIGFSVKDDKIDGKGHSLRDFSLLKQVTVNEDYKQIFNCITFDKYLKEENLTENDIVNTKQYFRWIGNTKTQILQDKINSNKSIYAKVITYAFNLDNPDTMMLSHSGVHSNNGNDKNNASYNLMLCKDLLAKNDTNVKVILTSKNEQQFYTIEYKSKPLVKFMIQIGAGKYNEVLKNKIIEALNTENFYIPIVLKYRDLQLKF